MRAAQMAAHLRDKHGYSLAESIRYSPPEMVRIHEREHTEGTCSHSHQEEGR